MVARVLALLAAGVSLVGLVATAATVDRSLQGRPGGPDPWAGAVVLAFLAPPYLAGIVCAVAARRAAGPAAVVLGGCALVAFFGWRSWRAVGPTQIQWGILLLETGCYQTLACVPVVVGGLRGWQAAAEPGDAADPRRQDGSAG